MFRGAFASLFLIFAALPAAAQTQVPSLVLAPLSIEKPELVTRLWRPISEYLEKTAGVVLRIEYSPGFDKVLEDFRAGRIDLAVLGSMPYLALRDSYSKAAPLVFFREPDGQAAMRCTFVAPAEAKLTVKQIMNKKVALSQPLCTCSYFAGEVLLRAAGGTLEQNRYRYLGNHNEIGLAVMRGDFDAGVMRTDAARGFASIGLAVIAETAPFPGFVLVANTATVTPQQQARIRQALLDAAPETRKDWSAYARHGTAPAADADFDALRKVSSGIRGMPAKGNY